MPSNFQNFHLIFVHGYTASSLVNWYPAISKMLEEVEASYSIPDLPGGKNPRSAEWLEIIEAEVEKAPKPIYLIGHSLGTRAVLLFLAKSKLMVEGVLLVAPLSNELANAQRRGGEAYPDFFEEKLDLAAVKRLSDDWLIIHSRDDQSLDFAQHGQALSEEMGVRIQAFEGRDHFTELEDAEAIFEVLKSLIGI